MAQLNYIHISDFLRLSLTLFQRKILFVKAETICLYLIHRNKYPIDIRSPPSIVSCNLNLIAALLQVDVHN